jgi:hypothetical protein
MISVQGNQKTAWNLVGVLFPNEESAKLSRDVRGTASGVTEFSIF